MTESFWTACRAQGPLILEVEDDGSSPTRHAFDRPSVVIGRDPRSDLRIDHPDVSWKHAYFQLIDGQLFCVDLESRTGLHTAEGRVDSGWVVAGDSIRIGTSRIWVRSGATSADADPVVGSNPLSARGAANLPGPATSLLVTNGDEVSSIPVVRRLTLIGRLPPCKIRLDRAGISRFHAALLRTEEGVWIVDLNATESVLVNGCRVHHARLGEGDELTLGPLQARVSTPELVGSDTLPALSSRTSTRIRPSSNAGGPGDRDLQPFLDQVASIQQSNEPANQVLVMLTQLFGNMHQEMVSLVREELEQIRLLSHELQVLRTEAAAVKPAPPAEVSTDLASPGAGRSRPPYDQKSANPTPPAVPPRSPDPREVHQVVSERLASFERERQGRWNRITNILLKTNP